MRATAIAEAFRQEGKKVLLLIDSLTRVAHAQREIGLTLGEPPTMKGYPPSVFALIPSLCERAGIDRETGGPVTALYTVLADGGDIDDPVVDSDRNSVVHGKSVSIRVDPGVRRLNKQHITQNTRQSRKNKSNNIAI